MTRRLGGREHLGIPLAARSSPICFYVSKDCLADRSLTGRSAGSALAIPSQLPCLRGVSNESRTLRQLHLAGRSLFGFVSRDCGTRRGGVILPRCWLGTHVSG